MDRKKLDAKLGDIAGKLRALYGERLISVILYGSAASGESSRGRSNVNLLIVLSSTDIKMLERSSRLIKSYGFRDISPVFFTESFIKTSADVFPIEFLDMKENYRVIYGHDVLKDLRVDTKNLRFQCEHELKSKLINIKKVYPRLAGARDIQELLFKSCTSVAHILRNVLRLTGHKPPYIKKDVLNEAGSVMGLDISAMTRILEAKNASRAIPANEAGALLGKFTAELENIADAVDKI